MVFSSMIFVCVFLPVIFLLHEAARPIWMKNLLLTAASLLFYAYGEPVYVFLLIGSAFMNYLFGFGAARKGKTGKAAVAVSAAANLGILILFKYSGFLVETFNGLTGMNAAPPDITMPIGISFFTFQAMSYVIDIYRGETSCQKNFGKVLLYISFFPQLIAGPIVKYHDIAKEIDARSTSVEGISRGLRRFAAGMGKKVLISNTMGLAADQIFGAASWEINAVSAWIGALAYLMQIYFDFSGYSDMAIGMGQIFGFHFKENFYYPYTARSIKDFWRRWHISLSGWFREYLYIPLGGNRKGKLRTSLNKIVVFFCTGFWHGASFNFICWGLYHGFFLLLEDWLPAAKKEHRILEHIYVLLTVCFGFVLFRADSLGQGLFIIKEMLTGFQKNSAAVSLAVSQLTPLFLVTFSAAVLLSFPVKDRIAAALKNKKVYEGLGYAGSILVLAACMLSLSGNSYNPFIYFRF